MSRILCLGDSPFVTTGFGVVNKVATDTLITAGHDLIVIGAQDVDERPDAAFAYIPSGTGTADVMGWSKAPDVIEKYRPDAVHIIADPATVTAWLIHDKIRSLPVVAYMPIEGRPLNRIWTKVWDTTPDLRFITCSRYGQEVLADEGYEAVLAYHGVSPDFAPYPDDLRDEMRRAVGWDDKFIVMNVATNVRRKQWPRLFEAIAMLKRRHPDIYLYAHTKPFNNFFLGGHDLAQLAEQIGVEDRVIFPHFPADSWNLPLRGSSEPGLVDLYNMADVFVLPSQVEGFGIPLAEAMTCGLPVITTGHGPQAEVVGRAGDLLPVNDWEWNQSHQKYANVHPRDIASAIEVIHGSAEKRHRMRVKSIERAKLFHWDEYRSALVEAFGVTEAQGRAA